MTKILALFIFLLSLTLSPFLHAETITLGTATKGGGFELFGQPLQKSQMAPKVLGLLRHHKAKSTKF